MPPGEPPMKSPERAPVRRWFGTALAAAALGLGLLLSPSPAADPPAAGLQWVPADSLGFTSVRAADLLNSDFVKAVERQLGKADPKLWDEIRNQSYARLKEDLGIDARECERITVLVP